MRKNELGEMERLALRLDKIVERNVKSFKEDWYTTDRVRLLDPANVGRLVILGTRGTGCELLVLGPDTDELDLDRMFGPLNNKRFWVYDPVRIVFSSSKLRKVTGIEAFRVATEWMRELGSIPVFEGNHCKLIRLWS